MNSFENTEDCSYLIRRLITEPADSVEGIGFRCEVVSIDNRAVKLKFIIVDKDGQTLRDLSTDRLHEGETITLFNFSKFFTVNVS